MLTKMLMEVLLHDGIVDDRVCSEVQHALLKLLQVRIQLESIVAGGESGDEDVRAFVVGLILLEVDLDYLHHVNVSDPDSTFVEKGIGDERESITCIRSILLVGFGTGECLSDSPGHRSCPPSRSRLGGQDPSLRRLECQDLRGWVLWSAIPYAFQFGLVFISTQSLDVALVRRQVHLFSKM